jgi:hypothetical protein
MSDYSLGRTTMTSGESKADTMDNEDRPAAQPMGDSRVLEVNGVFLGAAIALPNRQGWRLVAASDRLGRFNGCIAASWPEAQRLARQAFLMVPAA